MTRWLESWWATHSHLYRSTWSLGPGLFEREQGIKDFEEKACLWWWMSDGETCHTFHNFTIPTTSEWSKGTIAKGDPSAAWGHKVDLQFIHLQRSQPWIGECRYAGVSSAAPSLGLTCCWCARLKRCWSPTMSEVQSQFSESCYYL